jgi:amino acid permease
MLFDMAKEGRAPKWFSKLDGRGVPMNALMQLQHCCIMFLNDIYR